MLNSAQRRAVRTHLKDLASGRVIPFDTSEGICYEIKSLFGAGAMMELIAMIQDWPGKSPSKLFPIPCPFGGDPQLRYCNTADLWKGSYGAARKRLCTYLAKQLDVKL